MVGEFGASIPLRERYDRACDQRDSAQRSMLLLAKEIEQLRAERDAAVRANDLGAERMAELIVERDEARAQLCADFTK